MKKILVAALATAVFLVGCAVNPVTGKRELSLVSENQELAIGKQNYAPLRQAQGGDYVADKALVDYVSEVGQKLAAVSDRKLPYEFKVLNNSTPNAWALPGGKIVINRGLLTELDNEAQLAAVLGHEITHAAAKHTAKAMSRGMLLQGAVFATVVGTQGKDYAQLAQLGAGLGAQLVTQKYGRDAERESDYYGMKYMSKAGYDPAEAVELQRIFVRLSEGRNQDWLSGLFASHPPSRERVKNNEKALEKFPAGGIKGEKRFRKMIARLKNTKPAYEAYEKGRKALAEGNIDRARGLARQAIDIEPAEGLFYALLGDAEVDSGRYTVAKRYYDTAVDLNPGFFRNRLKRGLVNAKLNADAAAKADLVASVKLLPTSNAYYELGNIAKRQGDLRAAKAYFAKGASDKTDIGLKSYSALIEMDIGQNPGKYIEVRTGRDKSGRYKAELHNTTPRDISGLVIGINFVDSTGRPRQIQKPIIGTLKAGKREVVDLGLNATTQGIEGVRASIVAAKLAAASR
jgi:predicted Zn-dependent protease